MSFLDNLENNLKALEGRDEGGIDERARRDADLKQAKAAAPWADKLKSSSWTKNLMGIATRAGYERRIKVNLIWIGTSLRLEARGQRLELRPVPDGVRAVFQRATNTEANNAAPNEESRVEIINLEEDPRQLVNDWMTLVDSEVSATLPPDLEETET